MVSVGSTSDPSTNVGINGGQCWSLLCLDPPLFLNENRCCRHVRIVSLANLCKAGPAILVLDMIHFPGLEMVCGAQDSFYDLKIHVYKLILQGKDNGLGSCWSRQSC
jgi:hypothetical protein